MTLLEFRAKGLATLSDLRRVVQSTSPPVTAITMLPIAQLILANKESRVE
jgi:hypothetical protein